MVEKAGKGVCPSVPLQASLPAVRLCSRSLASVSTSGPAPVAFYPFFLLLETFILGASSNSKMYFSVSWVSLDLYLNLSGMT